MERALVVIDSFYEDPDWVRQSALEMEYPITGRFPGRNSQNLDLDSAFRRVVLALRLPVQVNPQRRDIVFFRLTCGSDEGTADIHVDPTGWAGVVYLNPNPPTLGGTSFFLHRRTGLIRWPSPEEVETLAARGLLPREVVHDERALDEFFAEEGRNRDRWEEIMHVPNVYNRAVFYNARQFHTIRDWRVFGDTPETARLTQLFFFDTGQEGRSS